MSTASHRIALLAYHRCQILDVAGPHEVFVGANRWLAIHRGAGRPYEVIVVGDDTRVVSESGLTLGVDHTLADPIGPVDTMLVPGGDGVLDAAATPAIVEWVRGTAGHADRIASVCSGTFLLGAAGLIAGRRVTTHWARAGKLARLHPEAIVDPDPIHVVDGPVWTSAGVTAGIDLALAMVEHDIGADCAQQVARMLVMFVRRPGGQSQFAAPVWTEATAHDGIRAALRLVHTDPGADLDVATLAAAAAMSPRHFSRLFTAEIGASPGRHVERVRLDHARRLLETSDLTLDEIARRCGFGTAETLRRVFARRLGTPPGAYRARFAPTPAGSSSDRAASPGAPATAGATSRTTTTDSPGRTP